MADVRVTDSFINAGVISTPDVRITQAFSLALIKFPSEEVRLTESFIAALVTSGSTIRVTDSYVLALVKGRTDNRKARAWTFSLDGHHFYVLRAGEDATLIYDLTTNQWSEWVSGSRPTTWRAQSGTNWIGMLNTYVFANSNVVAGDDTFGVLWVLDPDQGYDESPEDGSEVQFSRTATTFIPKGMRETERLGAVYLTASVGNPQVTGATITLRTSDDAGNTWQDHGTITATEGEYSQEFVWRSLGLIKQPGKLFEFVDNGASVRLDKLDIR
jgi:hypothetical protein